MIYNSIISRGDRQNEKRKQNGALWCLTSSSPTDANPGGGVGWGRGGVGSSPDSFFRLCELFETWISPGGSVFLFAFAILKEGRGMLGRDSFVSLARFAYLSRRSLGLACDVCLRGRKRSSFLFLVCPMDTWSKARVSPGKPLVFQPPKYCKYDPDT